MGVVKLRWKQGDFPVFTEISARKVLYICLNFYYTKLKAGVQERSEKFKIFTEKFMKTA